VLHRFLNAQISKPLSDYTIRSFVPKTGMAITLARKMKDKAQTIMDYRPDTFMYQLERARPITVPTTDQKEIQMPYSRFSLSLR